MGQSTYFLNVVAGTALVAAGLLAGCGGDEPPTPPEFQNPRVACEESGNPRIDEEVVTEISVKIVDPDRDLVVPEGGFEATLDGLQIALTDEDADQRFSWKPSTDTNRLVCNGAFDLIVTAADAEGNETTFDESIASDGG